MKESRISKGYKCLEAAGWTDLIDSRWKEDVIKEVIYFLARNITDNKKAQLEEVSEVKWFNFKDAIKQITFDNSREILIQLKKDLEN